MKIVTIIEDNAITGVRYGEIEIPDTEISLLHNSALRNYARNLKLRTDYIHRAVAKQRTKNK